VAPAAQPADEVYYADWEKDGWVEEPAGVDWLMVGLLVAALVAVLGLIPLWRTVYRRYAVPAPVPPAGMHYPLERGMALNLLDGGFWRSETMGWVELDGYGLVWYNEMSPSVRVKGTWQSVVLSDRFRIVDNVLVWESSLRVLGMKCTRMCGQQVVEA
jgi:hypothetical protein